MVYNVTRGSGEVFTIEALPDGSMGSLRFIQDPEVESSFAITDGLILCSQPLPERHIEWYCSCRHQTSGEVIDFVIVAGCDLEDALNAIANHGIAQALQWSGWVFETPWVPQAPEF
jgi:hypothetical protein